MHPPLPALKPPSDGYAITAFVAALCGMSFVAVPCALTALRRMPLQRTGGRWMAITALVLSFVPVVVAVFVVLVQQLTTGRG